MICKFCGQAINDGDKFCSFCGAPVNEQTTETNADIDAKVDDNNSNKDDAIKDDTIVIDTPKQDIQNRKFSAFSIAGFIVSLIGIFCFAIICGSIGLVLSGIGLGEAKIKRGKGLAIAGLVIGILDVLAFFLLL